jgi:hypothetical protein
MIASGRKSKCLFISLNMVSSGTFSVPEVSIDKDRG